MKKIIPLILTSFLISSCSQFSPPQPLPQPVKNQITTLDKNANTANQEIEPLEATFSSIKLNIINKKCISCHKPGGKAEDIPLTKESQVLQGSIDEGPLVIPGKASDSAFYKVMSSDHNIRGKLKQMPPKKSVEAGTFKEVTTEELQVVAAWINGVASNSNNSLDPKPVPVADCPTSTPPTPANPGGGAIEPKPIIVPENVDFAFIKTQILDKKCSKCHEDTDKAKAKDFPMQTKEQLLKLKTDSNESFLIPGRAKSSLIYLSLIKDEEVRQDIKQMPPPKAVKNNQFEDITDQEIKIIEDWINAGAK